MILGCHTSFPPFHNHYPVHLHQDALKPRQKLNSAGTASQRPHSVLRPKTCCRVKGLFGLLLFLVWAFGGGVVVARVVCSHYPLKPFPSSIIKLPCAAVPDTIISRPSLLLPQPSLLLFHIRLIQAPAPTICLILALCFGPSQR